MEDSLHLNDKDLVKNSLENPDHFRYVIERYGEKLTRYIKRRAKVNSHDVEDILQEVFIKIYRNLNDYDERLPFSSWVYRITHNYIIDWYRKEKKHDTIDLDDVDSKIAINLAGEENADKYSNEQENSLEIARVLDSMGSSYKDVIVLRYFEDKTYDEISDIMQIPVSLVGARLNRAKSMIKKKLLEKNKN
jgi:RNA polymerase sigma-70 factor (ECF subfamily)